CAPGPDQPRNHLLHLELEQLPLAAGRAAVARPLDASAPAPLPSGAAWPNAVRRADGRLGDQHDSPDHRLPALPATAGGGHPRGDGERLMFERPRLGVAYYPEQWPRERWALDARLMVEAGLRVARVGEFAWAK